MIRPSVVLCCAVVTFPPGPARAGSAEVKLDRDYLAGLVEKMPPLPFQSDRAHGTVHGARLTAIDPQGRRFVVACQVDGEYRPAAVIGGPWRKFRFEVRVGIHVEPGKDGTPRFRVVVEEVRRKEIEGFAGTLARMLGKYFDDLVTRVAAGKVAQLSDKLNAEVVRKVAAFKEYGAFTGIDYTPDLVVLHFDMDRLQPEAVAGYVFPASSQPPPGTVPLYRAVHPRLGAHLYTIDRGEAARRGFRVEGIACHVFDHPDPQTVPLYHWRIPRDAIYTTVRDGEGCFRYGYRPLGVACFLYPGPRPGAVPFYRFRDPRTGTHFYSVHPRGALARSTSPSPLLGSRDATPR